MSVALIPARIKGHTHNYMNHPIQDLLADYNCSCASGFTGRNCEMEEEEGEEEEGAESAHSKQRGLAMQFFHVV